jgi:DNA-binding response OmpR family regulator
MHKILVVDDSADIRLLLGRTLKAAGYQVFEATDGSEVFPAVMSYEPDLVLLDVAMPKIDGFKALGQLKADQRTRYIPVIMITAKGHPDDLETARSLGALDYINKPWGNGEVELRVQWAITTLERQRKSRADRKAEIEKQADGRGELAS